MRETFDRPLLWGLYFVAVTVVMAVDLVADVLDGEGGLHLILEGVIALFALGGGALMAGELRRRRQLSGRLRADLARAHADAMRWRGEAQELLQGLGAAIDRQFAAWQLSPAERDVALLMLKGLSHKEIAEVRATSERTVRQQAREVYRKAGVAGRAELAAWFLEDLLLPSTRGATGAEGA